MNNKEINEYKECNDAASADDIGADDIGVVDSESLMSWYKFNKGFMMEKKFELTEETQIFFKDVTLHRIRALRDFSDVKKGDLGGWIQKEKNLSHEGDCWIYDNAIVMNDARVLHNARMYDNARMSDNSRMLDNTKMFGNSRMFDNAQMRGNALIRKNATMYDDSELFGNAEMCGDSRMFKASIMGENAKISGYVKIYGNAKIYAPIELSGKVFIWSNATIINSQDIISFSPVGLECATLTVYKALDGLEVTHNDFHGTDVEFLKAISEEHGLDSKIGKEYSMLIEVARSRIFECEQQNRNEIEEQKDYHNLLQNAENIVYR